MQAYAIVLTADAGIGTRRKRPKILGFSGKRYDGVILTLEMLFQLGRPSMARTTYRVFKNRRICHFQTEL